MTTWIWDGPETGPTPDGYLVEAFSLDTGESIIGCSLHNFSIDGGTFQTFRDPSEELELTVRGVYWSSAEQVCYSEYSMTSDPVIVPEPEVTLGLIFGVFCAPTMS